MEKLNFFLIIILISFSNELDWRYDPTCRLGRLQSPIAIKESDSTYSNDFSFVYQDYKEIPSVIMENKTDYYTLTTEITNGGYINFERKGVIKQYKFIRAELYPALHTIDNDNFDYELHLVHEKILSFKTNKNQYRRITDPNTFLTVVLRYKNDCSQVSCTSDNGLISDLLGGGFEGLSKYAFFQEKRAYFYEGSSLHNNCDENVNYYIVKDFFHNDKEQIEEKDIHFTKLKPFNKFGRPIYRNFMNLKEVLKTNFISVKIITLFLWIFILI